MVTYKDGDGLEINIPTKGERSSDLQVRPGAFGAFAVVSVYDQYDDGTVIKLNRDQVRELRDYLSEILDR